LEYSGFDNKKHYSHTFKQLNPEWNLQKNNKKVETSFQFMNKIELEPDYFVSLRLSNIRGAVCDIKDNRGDNTIFKCYIFRENINNFICEDSGMILPEFVSTHPIFLNAVHQMSDKLHIK
jgi:hypothetical protein